MSVNKAILICSAGKDAEVRMVGETKVATFSVATNEKYKDSKSGEWKENTEWHNIVCWRHTAELAEKYIRKGTQLYIEGKIRTRSWEKDGEKRYVTEIVADTIQLLGKKEESAPTPATHQRPQYQTTPLVDGVVEPDDSDLPF
jgi:single-strand DNA-binding protein